MPLNDVGVIGLAVMGANLARNFARQKIQTIVYNRTAQKTQEFIAAFGNEFLTGTEDIGAFVHNLKLPRKILLMVQAGPAVDALVDLLLPFLDAGDMLIDGGNSLWKDTVRREEALREKGILFFGCGISGGEEGALAGPSLMPGGNQMMYEDQLSPLLEKIAARDFSGKPCVTWVGENGAGHYVKMVHNGIEYAVIQMLAEIYEMLRRIYLLPAPEIGAIFEKLERGKLSSFLTEIAVHILNKKDNLGDGYLINKILDCAEQKGTGKWAVIDALERGISVPTIAEAVSARMISMSKNLRTLVSRSVQPPQENPEIILSEFSVLLENALSAAMLSIYAQGYHLIAAAAAQQMWSINLSELSRIWQGGCIIRAKILGFLHDTFKNAKEAPGHLFLLPEIATELHLTLPALRKITALGLQSGIPLPGLSSALAYIEGMRQADGSANFIQALRDYFGAHTFERTDMEGVFHADWKN